MRPKGILNWIRRSIALRLTLLLTLALVPLGLLGFEQTRRLEVELDRVRGLNLHAITAEIARREVTGIARASGVARSMAATLPMLASDGTASCVAAARQVVERSDGNLIFVGFMPREGMMECTSSGETVDFSGIPAFAERMAAPERFVTSSAQGRMSGVPVISVHEPAYDHDGTFVGYVSVSLSARKIALPGNVTETDIAVALVTSEGEVLGATGDAATIPERLPGIFEPFDKARRSSFSAPGADGLERDYTVEPIVEGVAYAVGFRPPGSGGGGLAERVPAAVFPLLMWLASVALVLGVLETSLIGPVRALGMRMRRFGETRQLSRRYRGAPPLPAELALIEDTFSQVADQLKRDEARLIDAVEEREALLRELHHRVKNNLQIIASIINLQIRDAEAPKTKDALMRVNARIAGLATVHRRLYESDSLGQMRFDTLLRLVVSTLAETARPEVVGSAEGASRRTAPRLKFDTAPLRLSPNQGLPAAMFAVEALTNALKYATPDDSGAVWIHVRLAKVDGGKVELAIESSGRKPEDRGDGAQRRSLGQRLITGFARQLRGEATVGWRDDGYAASVVFTPTDVADDLPTPARRRAAVADDAAGLFRSGPAEGQA